MEIIKRSSYGRLGKVDGIPRADEEVGEKLGRSRGNKEGVPEEKGRSRGLVWERVGRL